MEQNKLGWKMARCSEIAYLDGKKAKSEYKKLGFTSHKFFNVRGAQCHATYDKKTIVFAFRGTEVKQWSDIKADLNINSVNAKYFYGKVHKGFQKEVDKLWKGIKDYVIKQSKNKQIIITGHSLGASMATIFTARLHKLNFKNLLLYTYGSPRVGNDTFINNLKVKHYRFVNNSDDVTKIPFHHWGYRHHGDLRYINYKGEVKIGMSMWKRILDKLKGRWDGFMNKNYFDGISDHSISKYAEYLLEYDES